MASSPTVFQCRAPQDALIVESAAEPQVVNVPVHVNSYNLTQELSLVEDARFCQTRPVNAERVRGVFGALYRAASPHMREESDRIKLILGRLLLGPVAVPCYCDEWEANDYMVEAAQFCAGPLLYVHRRCHCPGMGRALAFTVMEGHVATHVFRGLLSLTEWNQHLPDMFCPCGTVSRRDRYSMACLPRDLTLYISDYPYFMVEIGRVLTVSEVDDYVSLMTSYLGDAVTPRLQVHYKLLFGVNVRPLAPLALSSTCEFFILELQKMWLGVEYHNEVTADFFGRVFTELHRDRGRVMMALRLPEQTVCHLNHFTLGRFKRQVLYFKLSITYGKYKAGVVRNILCYRRLSLAFGDHDTVWRNLFYVYYEIGKAEPLNNTHNPSCHSHHPPPACSPRGGVSGASSSLVARTHGVVRRDSSGDRLKRYVCIISRLMFVRYGQLWRREKQGSAFDFTGNTLRQAAQEHHRHKQLAAQRHAASRRKFIGGMEFSEITGVSLDRIAVNAFNTNRVINMKAALSGRVGCRVNRLPKNMTHSFVMYKHTFKEPACTVSTFVSNDAVYTNSLNVNIRGSYPEFLYSLGVYRLHVNIDHFFLPAVVCNSNSSLDVHGLEDQTVIRSERSKVYWTTNFPCMISHTNNVNVGWFKAATAIVPRVSGSDLEGILLQELSCIKNMRDVCIDYGLHRVFTKMELRNSYQIPFLSKQLILFIRACLLKLHGPEKRLYLDRLVFEAVQRGVFDYSKNITAHTKIKHTCALIGSRLANNVPKILARNKKIKLDHLGRNANVLTVCRHLEANRISRARLKVLVDVLATLQALSETTHTQNVIRQTLLRLCGSSSSSSL
ncbi:protein UL87 [Cercopithecine betaherpesvirus 5]|uniref:Protein UL87 n=1 Tax=Simian cytomegalovirus (strain Colburn) TaxID=50292 RepID=G8XTF0_SCMVC|nr:protein UL87 [Cercopithecine betaherpesvirus 5]AEV80442.1 protein UL87 [Cercopithecine betaherpesvirus 5]